MGDSQKKAADGSCLLPAQDGAHREASECCILGIETGQGDVLSLTVEVKFEISSILVSLFLASPPLSKVKVDRSDMLMTSFTSFGD